jgi:hypothetical protein
MIAFAADTSIIDTAGWVFLLVSCTFVIGLVTWCFYRVLTLPPEE